MKTEANVRARKQPIHQSIRNTAALLCLAALAALLASCTPTGNPGGGTAPTPPDDTQTETDVTVRLGSAGQFTFDETTRPANSLPVQVRDEVPAIPTRSATVRVQPGDITVALPDAASQAAAVLTVRLAPFGSADVCSAGTSLDGIQLNANDTGEVTVTPESVEVPAGALPLLASGEFELCAEVLSRRAEQVTVDRLRIRYITTTDLTGFACDQILAVPLVQSAIETLDAEDIEFRLVEGDSPPDFENEYDATYTVTFDPDETDLDPDAKLTRRITFTNQADNTIVRTIGDASLTDSIQGADSGISLCAIARSNNPDCDQTIARFESVSWSEELQAWDGSYLAVVVERHDANAADCGPTGDFNFGTVRFRPTDSVSTNGAPTEN